MYIWEQPDWPRFDWDAEALRPRLDVVRLLQGRLLGRTDAVAGPGDLKVEMDALIQNALRTSEIEGEHLDVDSVRSSVARQLGLARAGVTDRSTVHSDALVGLLLEAVHRPGEPLTYGGLCRWQAALFRDGADRPSGVRVGELRGEKPMQVVSGRIDRPTVHFEAPPRERLGRELDVFLDWFNEPPPGLDSLVRAGVAHLWLITLHPFDDGNGRVARAVTDRALGACPRNHVPTARVPQRHLSAIAQLTWHPPCSFHDRENLLAGPRARYGTDFSDRLLAWAEQRTVRFYSLSEAIMSRRRDYYAQLEAAQKGDLDITAWLDWFLRVLEEALEQALARVERVLAKSRFWQCHAETSLSERQIKVLNRLLDRAGDEFPSGINAGQYRSMARVSKATATRDLADLLAKGCIERLPGGGRSTRYRIAGACVERVQRE